MHNYKTEQWLPISVEDAWKFFSTPKNLALITPPELGFKIQSKLNGDEIFDGMIIDYKVKPLIGIPVHWKTEICRVLKPRLFTDRQIKGPYKLWEHTHTFEKSDGGVLMKDEVIYELPMGFLGEIAHKVTVKDKIDNIFSYRKKILKKLFSAHDDN